MNEPRCTNRSRAGTRRSRTRRRSLLSTVLWRFRLKTVDLLGLVIETPFGYAFGLELDNELVCLSPYATLEGLMASADLAEAALLALGWRVVPDTPSS